MKESAWSAFKKAVIWSSDKIVTGAVKGVKLIPPADRHLTEWTTKLLQLMMKHKLVSLVLLVVVPAFCFLFLEADGILDPLSDALDVVTDVLSSLPFDLMLPLVLLGAAAGIGLMMHRRKISLGEAAKVVFYAIFARVFYLTVLLIIVIFFLQLTPLKGNRQDRDVIIPVKNSRLSSGNHCGPTLL